MVAAYEGFGDRTLNYGIGIVSRCELRPGGINLSTNVGVQSQLIEGVIQRVVENRDQNRIENSYRKQSSLWTKNCASSPEMRVVPSTLWQMRRVLPHRLFATGSQQSSSAKD
jgi:hypothetical protein